MSTVAKAADLIGQALNEEWRPVPGYEGLYEVSNLGGVRRIEALVHTVRGERIIPGRTLKTAPNQDGYPKVCLSKDNVRKTFFVHQLILRAFVRHENAGEVACHNDGNPSNSTLSNLRWDTAKGNSADAIKHGTHTEVKKTHCPQGHPLSGSNLDRRQMKRYGKRRCLACSRAHGAIRGRPEYKPLFKQVADLKYESIKTGTMINIHLPTLLAAANHAEAQANE